MFQLNRFSVFGGDNLTAARLSGRLIDPKVAQLFPAPTPLSSPPQHRSLPPLGSIVRSVMSTERRTFFCLHIPVYTF